MDNLKECVRKLWAATLVTALVPLVLLGNGPGLAQDVQRVRAIEEIVVTARKREETLQTVPIAVTAFSEESLVQQNLRKFEDVSRLVPNFHAVDGGKGGDFTIRAQRLGEGLIKDDPAVSLYLDGVLHARNIGFEIPFVDIARIEVLRGPQGTLFGRNTTGGAINITTKQPIGQYEFGAQIRVGNEERNDYTVHVNVPLMGDDLALRAAFQSKNQGGFGKSSVTGAGIQDEESRALFGSLLWRPAENIELIVRGDWRDQHNSGDIDNLIALSPDPAAAINSFIPIASGGMAVASDFLRDGENLDFTPPTDTPQFEDVRDSGVSLTATIDWGELFSTKLIVARRWLFRENFFETDGTPFTVLDANLPAQQRSWQVEFQIYGDLEFFNSPLEWFGGVFHFQESGLEQSASTALRGLNPLNPRWFLGEGHNDSIAGYAQINWEFVPSLTFTAGGRVTRDEKSVDARNQAGAFTCRTGTVASGGFFCPDGTLSAEGFLPVAQGLGLAPAFAFVTQPRQKELDLFHARQPFPGGDPEGEFTFCIVPNVDTPGVCSAKFTDRFTSFSWEFGLEWQAFDNENETLMLYAKDSRGFRSGGQNLRNIFPGNNSFDPETVNQVEAGFKSDWFGGNLRVNFAAFYQDISDMQVENIVASPAVGVTTIIGNAADASVYGFELEWNVIPLPKMIPGLELSGTVGAISPEFDEFLDFQPLNPAAPFDPVANPLIQVDRSDEAFTFVPEWNYTVSGSYTHPLNFGDIHLQVDWVWTDTVPLEENRSNLTDQDPFGLLNARLSLLLLSPNLELAVWCRNCANKDYKRSVLDLRDSLGFVTGSPGDPRTYGGEFIWKFGT